MPLKTMPTFELGCPPPDAPIQTGQEIPKDLDIFFRSEEQFIPAGKTFDELTAEEQALVKAKYRFDCLKPGIYQGITGMGNMI